MIARSHAALWSSMILPSRRRTAVATSTRFRAWSALGRIQRCFTLLRFALGRVIGVRCISMRCRGRTLVAIESGVDGLGGVNGPQKGVQAEKRSGSMHGTSVKGEIRSVRYRPALVLVKPGPRQIASVFRYLLCWTRAPDGNPRARQRQADARVGRQPWLSRHRAYEKGHRHVRRYLVNLRHRPCGIAICVRRHPPPL
jgi:hypothetical protein